MVLYHGIQDGRPCEMFGLRGRLTPNVSCSARSVKMYLHTVGVWRACNALEEGSSHTPVEPLLRPSHES